MGSGLNGILPPSPDGKVVDAALAQSTVPVAQATNGGGSTLLSVFGDNPYFQAGFGLVGLGAGLSVFRHGLVYASTALRRRMLVSLEINNKDPSYEWFLTWMAARSVAVAEAGAKAKPWSPRFWTRSHNVSVQTVHEQRKNGSSNVSFKLVAGPGTHFLRYRDAWMQVKRERETRSQQLMSGIPWETVTLTTLSRDREKFRELLAEARDMALHAQEGKLVIHTAWGTEWKPFGQPRRKRPLKSVVLAGGVAEQIEEDVNAFLQRRKWYEDRGIPYRRGYLLHGPPGSGKSSFIQALAGELSYDLCLLNLSERGLADDKLIHLLSNAPERSFVLIEDVDAAFNKRVQTTADGYQSSVTFSGFLNALDGVASGEERIIFMTTNHPERLDPALIRPGRVDLSVLLDDATPEQARRLFIQFYGGSDEVSQDELARMGTRVEEIVRDAKTRERRASMAALQGLFIRSPVQDAVAGIQSLLSYSAP
ncbi:BCS1 N terminal-domain-containing protein [Rhodofomes roseus]|uniref:BCS1 N terminal-domain-containing protein n=1 Tax=Rhodofomes roseus TaxID=34475 RepID=A0ABQ8KKJ1_9APHY|nr:BCS1 N terminal-domain-containing protein [Rhodofomes roseus]KAH9838621.1 BCS1 N terminal-domain-containing protein [Rhodofomes roseus]